MKNNILDAWIIVEHLSEGDISLKDKKNLRLDDLTDKKYYTSSSTGTTTSVIPIQMGYARQFMFNVSVKF